MRVPLSIIIATITIVMIGTAVSARAEDRTFVIGNNADDYGVDRCLASGDSCGAAVATAYCQSQDFAQARSFRKITREEITFGIAETCGNNCENFIAIECTR
jgi:hypothetical protein